MALAAVGMRYLVVPKEPVVIDEILTVAGVAVLLKAEKTVYTMAQNAELTCFRCTASGASVATI